MTLMRETHLVAAGSVIGREHLRLFKNNQDGVGFSVDLSITGNIR